MPTKWVASPPEDAEPRAEHPERPALTERSYTGPPRYTETPSWGFPAQPWRGDAPAAQDARTAVSPVRRVQLQAGLLAPLLRGLGLLAVLSAAGELWRYVLLLQSRSDALSAGAVAASDALVKAASWVATGASVCVGGYLLVWVLRMVAVSSEQARVRPSRSRLVIVAGWLVPGINVAIPGSVLAEIEHAALRRPAHQRPSPSRLLRVWWLLWAANVLLGVLTVLWSLRGGVQAQADGVELHALVDLVVAATAEVTARVVVWLTALVSPPTVGARPMVVRLKQPTPAG